MGKVEGKRTEDRRQRGWGRRWEGEKEGKSKTEGWGDWGKRAESSPEKLPSDFTGQAKLKDGERGTKVERFRVQSSGLKDC